jgi:hypothetical protein
VSRGEGGTLSLPSARDPRPLFYTETRVAVGWLDSNGVNRDVTLYTVKRIIDESRVADEIDKFIPEGH